MMTMSIGIAQNSMRSLRQISIKDYFARNTRQHKRDLNTYMRYMYLNYYYFKIIASTLYVTDKNNLKH